MIQLNLETDNASVSGVYTDRFTIEGDWAGDQSEARTLIGDLPGAAGELQAHLFDNEDHSARDNTREGTFSVVLRSGIQPREFRVILADGENNSERWWNSLRRAEHCHRVPVELLVIGRGHETMVSCERADELLSWAAELPGWRDGPVYAPTALLARDATAKDFHADASEQFDPMESIFDIKFVNKEAPSVREFLEALPDPAHYRLQLPGTLTCPADALPREPYERFVLQSGGDGGQWLTKGSLVRILDHLLRDMFGALHAAPFYYHLRHEETLGDDLATYSIILRTGNGLMVFAGFLEILWQTYTLTVRYEVAEGGNLAEADATRVDIPLPHVPTHVGCRDLIRQAVNGYRRPRVSWEGEEVYSGGS